MQERYTAEEPRSKTFEYLRAKLAAIANSGGSALDTRFGEVRTAALSKVRLPARRIVLGLEYASDGPARYLLRKITLRDGSLIIELHRQQHFPGWRILTPFSA
jgi:hypothetical protein